MKRPSIVISQIQFMKIPNHEIVNCEIIHDVSMLIYILTTEILFVTKSGINQDRGVG